MRKRTLFFIPILGCTMLLISSCASFQHTSRKRATALTPSQQRKFDYFFLEACVKREQGKYDEAYELLKHCFTLHPHSAVLHAEIAPFYPIFDQKEKTIESYRKAIALNPSNFWYRQQLTAYYYQKQKVKEAIELAEETSRIFPKKKEVYYQLIQFYENQKNYPKEIEVLERLEQLDGKSEQLSVQKTKVYYKMGNKARAYAELNELIAEYPHDPRYRILLGSAYLDNNRLDSAHVLLQQALQMEPNLTEAKIHLLAYYDKKEQKEAYDSLQNKLLTNAEVAVGYKVQLLSDIIQKNEQGNRDSLQVIQAFEQVIEHTPNDTQIPMLYIKYLTLKKRKDKAIPVIEQLLTIDPENIAARLELIQYYYNTQKNTEKAKAICIEGLKYTPEQPIFAHFLAIIYYIGKEEDKAQEVLEKSLTYVTEGYEKLRSDNYSILGDIYHQKEQDDKAFAAYEEALTLNPDNIGVLNNYAYFLSLKKQQLDKAEEMSYKTVKAEPKNATYLDTYAWILFIKKKYKEAKIYIDDAMKNGGNTQTAVVEHCGDIYYMNGLKKEAIAYWKMAAALDGASKIVVKKAKLRKYIEE